MAYGDIRWFIFRGYILEGLKKIVKRKWTWTGEEVCMTFQKSKSWNVEKLKCQKVKKSKYWNVDMSTC